MKMIAGSYDVKKKNYFLSAQFFVSFALNYHLSYPIHSCWRAICGRRKVLHHHSLSSLQSGLCLINIGRIHDL